MVNPKQSNIATGGRVLSRSLWHSGVAIILLSLAICGLAIADIVLSVTRYCTSTIFVCSTVNDNVTTFNADPITFTFISAGIWGSIPIFITGVLAATLRSSHPERRVGYLQMACVMSLLLAIPAIIVITILELISGAVDAEFYTFNTTSVVSGDMWKFVIPLVVGILAVIAFFLVLGIVVYICRLPPWPGEPTKIVSEDVGPYRRLDEVPAQKANVVRSQWTSGDVTPTDNYRIVSSQYVNPGSNPYGAVPYREPRYPAPSQAARYIQPASQSLDRYYPAAAIPTRGMNVYANAQRRSMDPYSAKQQQYYNPYSLQHM